MWSGTSSLAPVQLNKLTFLINKHLSSEDGLKMWGITGGYAIPLTVELIHDGQGNNVVGPVTDSRNRKIATFEFNVNESSISFSRIQ